MIECPWEQKQEEERTHAIPTSPSKTINLLLPIHTPTPLLRCRNPLRLIHAFRRILNHAFIAAQIRTWRNTLIWIDGYEVDELLSQYGSEKEEGKDK